MGEESLSIVYLELNELNERLRALSFLEEDLAGNFLLKDSSYYCFVTTEAGLKRLRSYAISFEDVFEQVPEAIQEQLIYHLNIFNNRGSFKLAWCQDN